MARLIFTCCGYAFWRDDFAFWNVTREGDLAPRHCAYSSPEAIARLKGVDLRNIRWSQLPD
jgi:hypothetical protein